jgi:hypothetical protein
MDLVEASEQRIPIAIEVAPGHTRLPGEILRMKDGRIAWLEDAWLLDPLYSGNALHVIDEEPTGEGPEWRAGRLRFHVIPETDRETMRYWRGYEEARERAGAEAVRARALEIAESEFGTRT